MDHEEASDSEGKAPEEEIAEDPFLRGNSIESTEKSMAEDSAKNDEAMDDVEGQDEGHESMDVDASGDDEEGSNVTGDDDEPEASAASSDVNEDDDGEGDITRAPSPTADNIDEDVGAEDSEPDQKQPSDAMESDAADDQEDPLDDGPTGETKPVGESSANVDEEAKPNEKSEPNTQSSTDPHQDQSANPLGPSLSVDQSSFDQGPDMSNDEMDTDKMSDKASSADVPSDSAATPTSTLDSKRAPLIDAYGPFIEPEDTCLEDARERLHMAIEQTRLLRESLTEQAYERYRCVVKPAPESLDEILDPILEDPIRAGKELVEKAEEIRVEKELEKKQAQKAGVVPEELAYFGEGLHLVILPEDEVDENEIDLSALPTRGPIDPETGERVEDITVAYANATELVFDRIRRIRAIRMGGDITEVGKQQAAVKQMKRNLVAHENNDSVTPGYASATAAAAAATVAPIPPAASPAPSMNSDTLSDAYQKGSLQHLLTLVPDVEGTRPDGSYTAAQSALIAHGVGMHETKRDRRINPQHQRLIQPNYFSENQALPPLLRPNDVIRLQAADAHREGIDVRSSARESIKSVVEGIFLTGGSNISSSSSIRKALGEEKGALEIGLLRRMRKGTSTTENTPSEAAKKTIESLQGDTAEGTDADPLLAFSVMNAVGLVLKKEGNGQNIEDTSQKNGYSKALGLDDKIAGLESVSKFLDNGKSDKVNNTDAKKSDNGGKDEGVSQIRGGGEEDVPNEETKEQKNSGAQNEASDQIIPDPYHGHPPLFGASALGHPDPYHTATIAAHHLNMGQMEQMSDFYIRNSLAEVAALRAAEAAVNPSLGLFPGGNQMNFSLSEHEALRMMLLREHQNAAATAAVAARYGLPSQNPFDFAASSLSQSIPASLPASQTELLQRKRSSSLSESTFRNTTMKKTDGGKSIQPVEIIRAASAPPSPHSPPSPHNFQLNNTSFDLPRPPKGLHQDIADLIAHAKFHEAHSLSQEGKADDSKALIKFLLSLGAAVPIPKKIIMDALVKKIKSSNYQLRLHEFVGNSKSASASRDVIVAIISIWLWADHKDCLKAIVEGRETEPSYVWLINVAIDKSLSALATFFDSHPSGKRAGPSKDTPNEQVAAIASKSLANQVCVDQRMDAAFPIMEDLLRLLDSLRTDALKAKTQERVLLAALASRCGNMTEAFSNAYVSSIVRAGEALGHENVCEFGQDEECRASTLLPYDYFHDTFGVWEEPCRPTSGYYPSVGVDELKKRAHARSVIQKSMKKLQNRLSLKGGILDGGPYFPMKSKKKSKQSTMTVAPPLQRTPSGSMKRRGSYDSFGQAAQESTFNPEHQIGLMPWSTNHISHFPYGQYEVTDSPNAGKKKRKLNDGSAQRDGQIATFAAEHSSTQELEWDNVANQFFHTDATEIDYDFSGNVHIGNKKIFAPYVNSFDRSSLEMSDDEPSSDEDISDETILLRHQKVLDDMKIKLDEALESRKQQSEKIPPVKKVDGRKKKRDPQQPS